MCVSLMAGKLFVRVHGGIRANGYDWEELRCCLWCGCWRDEWTSGVFRGEKCFRQTNMRWIKLNNSIQISIREHTLKSKADFFISKYFRMFQLLKSYISNIDNPCCSLWSIVTIHLFINIVCLFMNHLNINFMITLIRIVTDILYYFQSKLIQPNNENAH